MKKATILLVLSLAPFTEGLASVKTIPAKELVEKDGVFYALNDVTPYTGRVVGEYHDGQIRFESHYQDGIKNGKETTWYTNGNTLARDDGALIVSGASGETGLALFLPDARSLQHVEHDVRWVVVPGIRAARRIRRPQHPELLAGHRRVIEKMPHVGVDSTPLSGCPGKRLRQCHWRQAG